MGKKGKTVQLDLRIPNATLATIDAVVETGLLGETRDAVIAHILREHLFQQAVRNIQAKLAADKHI